MFLITRRRLLMGAATAGVLGVERQLRADDFLPDVAVTLWGTGPTDRWIADFAILPDGSIVLSLVDQSVPPQRVACLVDRNGVEQWRTLLGDQQYVTMNRAITGTRGAEPAGIYAATGFDTVARLSADGRMLWLASLIDQIGLRYQMSMIAHPDGGLVMGGYARRPGQDFSCDDGVVVGVNGDGRVTWIWRCRDLGHCFPTTMVATDDGTTIVHLTNRDPQALGSAGDACEDPELPQWIAWFDPKGRLSRLAEWPADRRAEAMTLDRRGRLVFYGLAVPDNRSFFRVLSSADGALILDRVFDDGKFGSLRPEYFFVDRRRLSVSDRGVSMIDEPLCSGFECQPRRGTMVTLGSEDEVAIDMIPAHLIQPKQLLPDASAIIAIDGRYLIRVPIGPP